MLFYMLAATVAELLLLSLKTHCSLLLEWESAKNILDLPADFLCGFNHKGTRGRLEGWGNQERKEERHREQIWGGLRPHCFSVWGTGLPVGRRGRLEVLEGEGPTEGVRRS